MDYPHSFARHYSRLVWLLLNEPDNVDEQQAALRAAVTVSKDGPVQLVARDWHLIANGETIADSAVGVQDLSAQMIGHAVREVHFTIAAAPTDMLGSARILADVPVPGDGGAHAMEKLRELAAGTVRFVVGAEATFIGTVTRAGEIESPNGTPLARHEAMGSLANAIAKRDLETVFSVLDMARSASLQANMLEEIALLGERASQEGDGLLVSEILGGVVSREEAFPEGSDSRRVFGNAFRRLAKPAALTQIALLLPRRRGRVDLHEKVLLRSGPQGAEVLVEQLTAAAAAEDRRTYYTLLLRFRAAVPALVHLLSDPRWYAVRNGAELLGELKATEAERPLIQLLHHADDRVRRSASTALVRLGTPKGMQAITAAIRHDSTAVRSAVAGALSQRKDKPTAMTLVRALDDEQDDEVRLAIIAALGRVGTDEAVQRLVAMAEPGGRFFNKKSTALRVAAVQGLGEARTSAALAALTALTEDREREVRDAALRALSKPT